MGASGTGAEGVYGVYLDDRWVNSSSPVDAPDCASGPVGGPTEVNSGCEADIGLTQAQTTAITDGYHAFMLELQAKLLAAGKFSWAYFAQYNGGAPSRGAVCRSFFRNNATSLYGRAMMMSLSKNATTGSAAVQRDLAAFLAVRGPYAWLGHGWEGCSTTGPSPLPEELSWDVGVPLGNVTEPQPGVFARAWSKAAVQFDCNAWVGSVVLRGEGAAAAN